jgi:ABC-type Mn2+/Zn2+ transport system ATPase subunit
VSTSPARTTLHDQVRDRLTGSALTAEAQDLVLAALGTAAPPASAATPGGIYLQAVSVRGFRGIGRSIRLALPQGNGLTVVTGRNGSGKSSFAEAIEMAFTGENSRWKDRTQVWTGGFANMHEGVSPEIEVEVAISGDSTPSLLNLTWTGQKHTETMTTITRPGRAPVPLAELGLGQALADHRPFLPYAELGTALDSTTEIYDKISAVLGLGPLADACKSLHEQVLALEKTIKKARQLRVALVDRLAIIDEPRARAAHAELSRTAPGLGILDGLLAGDGNEEYDALRRKADLPGPEMQPLRDAADRLHVARQKMEQVKESAAEDARARAELLELALAHHRRHTDDPTCPVCDSADRLDQAWATRAAEEISMLRTEAAAVENARRELRSATERLGGLVVEPPADLPDRVAMAWQEWLATRSLADLGAFVAAAQRLAEECQAVRDEARQRLSALDGQWRQVAPEVAAWCQEARAAGEAQMRLAVAKKADDWARELHDDLRTERMAAQGGQARMYWQIMRGQSNVALGEIRLAGQGRGRRAELDVRVDDIPSAALGVMSQGELHALALSLFLPRALAEDSPFRFLIIDDPVQSMDPEKVDGLAQLLEEVAKRRQVVVFTHDSRLPEAIRSLRIEATILEVIRKERSEVAVTVSHDPVERALKDARIIARHPRLPAQVGPTVLPGLCRVALEAAFVEVARRRLLGTGVDHAVAEHQIAEARSTGEIAALALDVPYREVADELTRRFGTWAGKAYCACNQGAHDPQRFHELLRGTGKDPIEYVSRLARELREVR